MSGQPATVKVWEGEFGRAYTDRNVVDWSKRLPAFQEMVGGLGIERMLEVGCNRGHNLVALRQILGAGADICGVEPNSYALDLARSAEPAARVVQGSAFDLPFEDGYFDLVMTAGVLIHLDPRDLPRGLAEIYRVSRRYILAIEYYAEKDTEIPYRGQEGLLWKRDYRRDYQQQFSDLRLLRNGYCSADQGLDRCDWWLLEKTLP
jgi:pseudaminic acid biosynthesis-associated methylase